MTNKEEIKNLIYYIENAALNKSDLDYDFVNKKLTKIEEYLENLENLERLEILEKLENRNENNYNYSFSLKNYIPQNQKFFKDNVEFIKAIIKENFNIGNGFVNEELNKLKKETILETREFIITKYLVRRYLLRLKNISQNRDFRNMCDLEKDIISVFKDNFFIEIDTSEDKYVIYLSKNLYLPYPEIKSPVSNSFDCSIELDFSEKINKDYFYNEKDKYYAKIKNVSFH